MYIKPLEKVSVIWLLFPKLAIIITQTYVHKPCLYPRPVITRIGVYVHGALEALFR